MYRNGVKLTVSAVALLSTTGLLSNADNKVHADTATPPEPQTGTSQNGQLDNQPTQGTDYQADVASVGHTHLVMHHHKHGYKRHNKLTKHEKKILCKKKARAKRIKAERIKKDKEQKARRIERIQRTQKEQAQRQHEQQARQAKAQRDYQASIRRLQEQQRQAQLHAEAIQRANVIHTQQVQQRATRQKAKPQYVKGHLPQTGEDQNNYKAIGAALISTGTALLALGKLMKRREY